MSTVISIFARSRVDAIRQEEHNQRGPLGGAVTASGQEATHSKQTDDALMESRRYLQALFENSLDAIFVTNDEGRYIDANPAACELLGYTHNELTQLSVMDLTAESFREEARAMWQQFLTGGSQRGEYSTRRKDGEILQLEFRAVANVLPGLHVSSSRGITKRYGIERAQRESQEQYETLVQSLDGIVWEADPRTFMFTFVSKQAERILGYPLERWFESSSFWPDHMHPDDRDWAVAYCVDFTTRKVDHQFEYRMIAADGHVVWLSDIVTVHVADDQSVLLRGVMVDITERKLIEEKLRESESQLGEAQRLASVGSWNYEIATSKSTWSAELYRIYGLDPAGAEPSYETFIEIVHPDDRASISQVIEDAIKTQAPINFHLRIIRPDGAERIVHSRGNPVCDQSGTTIRMHGTVQDVTERKLAEDALRAAEQKYRDIFENAGEGIFQSTPDGRYIAVNPTLAHMYGFASPEEFIRDCHDISRQIYVDPTRREEFKQQLKERGFIREFDYQAFRKDGSKFWISVNARAVRDEQGAIQYYEGTGQDITERKRAEDLLRESEERYRELFENAKDATYVHDLQGRYTSVNRAAEKLVGYLRAEILGKVFTSFVPPGQIGNMRDQLCRKLAEEGETSYEAEVVTKDGRRVAVEVCSHLILENGAPVGVQGTARDITERKRAAQKLGEYEKAVEGLDEMIVVIDREYRYLLANRAFLKYRGIEREQLIGRLVSEVLNQGVFENITRQKLDECFAGNIVKYESTYHFPSLGDRHLFISYFPIENSGGIDRVACVLKDITETKLADERIKANSEQLRALSARLQSAREEEGTRIAREIHDELGSVLTGLKWDLESADKILAAPMGPSEPAALREKLHELVKLTDLAIGSIRRIASELRPSVLDDLGLAAAIEWQAQQFQTRTGIDCHCDSSLETSGLSDEKSTAAFRILQEALTNVLRHAQATRVDIRVSEETGYFVLSIRDNGRGITEAEKSEQGSLGILGMRERAHLVGGEIDIKGVEGQGTEVIVRVPTQAQERVTTG
jgi:PAS domain S-box-containing protein